MWVILASSTEPGQALTDLSNMMDYWSPTPGFSIESHQTLTDQNHWSLCEWKYNIDNEVFRLPDNPSRPRMNGRQKEEMITPGKIIEILARPAPPATPNTHFILRECGTNSRLVRWFSLEEFKMHPCRTPTATTTTTTTTTTTKFPINIIENRIRYSYWWRWCPRRSHLHPR